MWTPVLPTLRFYLLFWDMRIRWNFIEVISIRSAELCEMPSVHILTLFALLKEKVVYKWTAWTVRKNDKSITETIHKRFLALSLGITLKTQITKWINKKQTNSMKSSSSLEATSRSSTQIFSQQFSEPEDSLPCSHEPSTGTYPQPDESSPYHPILLSKFHFNIILPPMSRSSCWSLSFWLSQQNTVSTGFRSHACYMPCQSHPL
jgi:hypothetical protein